MTLNLKTTIIASSALAGLLNLFQFTSSYAGQAKASFTPSWNQTTPVRPQPTPLAEPEVTVTVEASPASTPEPAAATQPEPTPTPPAAVVNPAAAAEAKLTAAGLKPAFAASYLAVQAKTGTPWQILAAVHRIETGQAGDSAIKSYAGATGPMQFMPATFRAYAQDGDANGSATITDFDDSVLTAGNYLAANGAARGNYQNALFRYNHSNVYVADVLAIARRLGL